MFSSPMEENRSGIITITDFTSETIRSAISFFYNEEMKEVENFNELEELFRFSDKYDIETMKVSFI